MPLPQTEQDAIIERYSRRFEEHGYDPKTLEWDKGKQQIRFTILTSQYEFRGKEVLDIGCGFGDLNQVLEHRAGSEYKYQGVDLVPVHGESEGTLSGGKHKVFLCRHTRRKLYGRLRLRCGLWTIQLQVQRCV